MKSNPLRIFAIAGQVLMLAIVMIFSVSAIFAQAQVSTADLNGTVVDPNGAIVSGASVTVRNTETGFQRTVTSNSDGFFSAPLLPLGKYRVTTTASGFSETNFHSKREAVVF